MPGSGDWVGTECVSHEQDSILSLPMLLNRILLTRFDSHLSTQPDGQL